MDNHQPFHHKHQPRQVLWVAYTHSCNHMPRFVGRCQAAFSNMCRSHHTPCPHSICQPRCRGIFWQCQPYFLQSLGFLFKTERSVDHFFQCSTGREKSKIKKSAKRLRSGGNTSPINGVMLAGLLCSSTVFLVLCVLGCSWT